eukprot:3386726-Alexandrium_andersonii.AAC.1
MNCDPQHHAGNCTDSDATASQPVQPGRLQHPQASSIDSRTTAPAVNLGPPVIHVAPGVSLPSQLPTSTLPDPSSEQPAPESQFYIQQSPI